MAIVTGDRYVEKLVKFVEFQAGPLIDGTLVLKLNPVGLHYVHSRLESLGELEGLLAGAPVDYLRAYVSDLGDHRALEQLRRILRLLTSLKVVSVLPPPPARDPTPLSFLPFGRLKFLELRGCDLSTSAARGLLELRHTLEKLICHNSTDALQHVFASRFADIKKSPQWNRLSFVSCACNDLVLMDESLQLLPAVETLDLSRNKFSKIDNLRRCNKLKHLDLGFNNLRTIASLSEVTCHITKLILRNNALTSLRGLENLKSLEGLDVSYNIISNFSELEILAGLPLLINLWLEGNPLCCARWYRAQVFSLVSYAERLKIDNQGMTTREFWKRHIIIARRQKRPSSFGFYSLAKDDAECEGIINRRKKKLPRLASIESEDESVCICSDQGSVSCDNESPNKEENDGNDDEAEIVHLMNRVELLKKERSVLWLREVKQWMDQGPDCMNGALSPRHISKNKMSCGQYGETSRNMSDSIQASGDGGNTNCLEPHAAFAIADASFQIHGHQYIDYKSCSQNGGNCKPSKLQLYSQGGISNLPEHVTCSCFDLSAAEKHQMGRNPSGSPLSAVDGIMDSHSSSVYPGSPPHYKEDILHRRNNLVEEILQLSADSFSVVSSDSNTSCSDDDFCEYGSSHFNSPLTQEYPSSIVDGRIVDNTIPWRYHDFRRMLEHGKGNVHQLDASVEQTSYIAEHSQPLSSDGSVSHSDVPDNSHFLNQDGGSLQRSRSRSKRKTIKRVISLSPEKDVAMNPGISRVDQGDELGYQTSNQISTHEVDDAPSSGGICSFKHSDDFIADYFRNMVAESESPETCRQYLRCDCVLEQDSIYREREVAVLLSSEQRLYVLLIGTRFNGSGTIISMLGCHMIQDVKEVTVGMGLQVVRVCVHGGPTYVYITRSIEKSRQLLEVLQVVDAYSNGSECSVRSLESIQVELFSKLMCGGSKSNIYQYSMVLFWHSGKEGKSWLTRSLFVTRSHLIVCVEDIKQFGSLATGSHSPPYYTLVLCCNIADVAEMVVQEGDKGSVVLELNRNSTQFPPPAVDAGDGGKIRSDTVTWKLKWYELEKGRVQFVTLLKALHAQTAAKLFVRYMP